MTRLGVSDVKPDNIEIEGFDLGETVQKGDESVYFVQEESEEEEDEDEDGSIVSEQPSLYKWNTMARDNESVDGEEDAPGEEVTIDTIRKEQMEIHRKQMKIKNLLPKAKQFPDDKALRKAISDAVDEAFEEVFSKNS